MHVPVLEIKRSGRTSQLENVITVLLETIVDIIEEACAK